MADNRLKLTNRRVADLVNTNVTALWFYDSDNPGFALTVSPRGKRVFYYVGRVKGKPSRIKLGTFPTLSAEDARKAARKLAGEVAAGQDVQERRRQGRATLGDLWTHYLETHARPSKRTWQRDVREWETYLQPTLGKVPLSEIERDDVSKLVANIERENGKGPARKCRSLLSTMFEVGIAGKWCILNPVRGTRRPDFDPRQRYLKVDELHAFMEAVHGLRFEIARDFILLSLYTGQRRSNVCSMRWDELDFSARLWIIPAGKYKGKKPHVVPLSTLALEILQRRREARNGSPWVLPGRGKEGHYAHPKEAWARVLDKAGIENLRIHDLRRSLGAWQQRQGASLRTIQQTMGHSTADITARVYSPMEVEQVRESVDAALAATFAAAGKGAGHE